MSLAVGQVIRSGKHFIESLVQRGIPVRAGPKVRGFGERQPLEIAKAKGEHRYFHSSQKSLFSGYLNRSLTESFAARVGRETAKRLWTKTNKGGRLRQLTLYGFVGVSLANSTNTDELLNPEPICKHLTELFSVQEEIKSLPIGKSVEDYNFGRLIATGCDAAVYEVNSATNSSVIESNEESFENVKDGLEESFEIVDWEEDENLTDGEECMECSEQESDDNLSEQDLEQKENMCIKVMYNYGISSNSIEIERAMIKELLPVRVDEDVTDPLCGAHVKKKRLPPHPNIVHILGWFVDSTPLLEDALAMYPCALPSRLCANGYGRNSTMFIVMKKYESTLADYIHACGAPDIRTGAFLLLQLLHAILHLQRNQVAHRDLKSDNLLLEWHAGQPHLVISDFGHSVTSPLLIPYPSDCVNKGGNGKLMAPEIATAEPNSAAMLDFRTSDVWAAGTIAYEMFGGVNPFYTSAYDSRTYVGPAPPLPLATPQCMQHVVEGLLRPRPEQRLSAHLASNIVALWLWAPSNWQKCRPSSVDVLRWLLCLSASIILGASEGQQMSLFLSRLEWHTLWQAVELITDEE